MYSTTKAEMFGVKEILGVVLVYGWLVHYGESTGKLLPMRSCTLLYQYCSWE